MVMIDFIDCSQFDITDDEMFSIHSLYGESISPSDVMDSVHESSSFFGLDDPCTIGEGWTTAVINNSPGTDKDDVLIFNREQLADLGITDKEGFDLVMTHEAAHRALQDMDTGFSERQEEACCDYFVGVRAAACGLDESKIEHALGHTQDSASHPDGVDRVVAIERGISFTNSYMETHDGQLPSFQDCLEDFKHTRVFDSLGNDCLLASDSNSFIDGDEGTHYLHIENRAVNLKMAEQYFEKEKIELHEADLDSERGNYSEAAEHARKAASYHRTAKDYQYAASICKK